jgi:hypothetical protein
MGSQNVKDIAELFRQRTPITEALNSAVREAVRQHKQAGQPLVVWRDGKMVLISPELVPPCDTQRPAAEAAIHG